MAATGTLLIPQRLTEFLIPLTIVATGIENLLVRARAQAVSRSGYRPLFAGVFGLVHGAGFASYLQQLFIGSVVVPLFGFNVGIELGQLVVLAAAGAGLAAFDHILLLARLNRVRSYRLRVVTVSLVVVALAAEMAAVDVLVDAGARNLIPVLRSRALTRDSCVRVRCCSGRESPRLRLEPIRCTRPSPS